MERKQNESSSASGSIDDEHDQNWLLELTWHKDYVLRNGPSLKPRTDSDHCYWRLWNRLPPWYLVSRFSLDSAVMDREVQQLVEMVLDFQVILWIHEYLHSYCWPLTLRAPQSCRLELRWGNIETLCRQQKKFLKASLTMYRMKMGTCIWHLPPGRLNGYPD